MNKFKSLLIYMLNFVIWFGPLCKRHVLGKGLRDFDQVKPLYGLVR